MPIVVPSCSLRGVTGDVPRTEQRWDERPEMRPVCPSDRIAKAIMSMRRPRFGLVSRIPGGPGQPSAGTMTGCLEWLHACDDKGAVAIAPDRGPGSGLVVARKHGSEGHKTPQVERREAPSSDRKEEGDASQASHRAASPAAPGVSHTPAPAGAPLPLREPRFGFATRARPGPTSRIRAAERWLFEI